MPRARISNRGIDIAKPGYDVDTAPLNQMQFSSSLVAARVAQTGIVTPSYWDEFYDRAFVFFPQAYSQPPLILVAGIMNGTQSDQAPFLRNETSASQGMSYHLPYYEIRSYNDKFELFVAKMDYIRPASAQWRYWAFQNTLS